MVSPDKTPRLSARLARDPAEVRAAQRLRYEVFVRECGGSGQGVDHAAGLERDTFDDHADHLLLLDESRSAGDQVVGAYRLMGTAQAARAGGFYSTSEYDLAPLLSSGRRLLELGRSCLHPEYRQGAGMFVLWQALAGEVARHEAEILFGTASFPGADMAAHRDSLSLLHHRFLAPADLRVRSRQPFNLFPAKGAATDRRTAMLSLPPLIRAYLRLGGVVGEGAFVDSAFNTVDICMILDLAAMSPAQRALYQGGTP